MVLSAARHHTNRLTHQIAWVLEKLGFSPTGVTFVSLAITAGGAYLIATGHFVSGALVGGFGAVLDAFDGALARRLGRESAFGGYLDSLVDRYGDAAVFFAVGWWYDEAWVWAIVVAALTGAMATSYAKARVYHDIRPPKDGWHDLLERPERMIVLLFGVGFQGLAGVAEGSYQFLPWLVLVLAVLGHITVIQRALRARRFLVEAGHGPP